MPSTTGSFFGQGFDLDRLVALRAKPRVKFVGDEHAAEETGRGYSKHRLQRCKHQYQARGAGCEQAAAEKADDDGQAQAPTNGFDDEGGQKQKCVRQG